MIAWVLYISYDWEWDSGRDVKCVQYAHSSVKDLEKLVVILSVSSKPGIKICFVFLRWNLINVGHTAAEAEYGLKRTIEMGTGDVCFVLVL